jgi:hypothetical protein
MVMMVETSKERVPANLIVISATALTLHTDMPVIASANKATDELCYKTKTKQYIIGIGAQAEACVFTKRPSATSDALASL